MPTLAVLGTQWGDEGKGKLTDFLAEDADMVVRFQGGTNAGHTIGIGDEVFKLHLLPSGILRPGTTAVIGNGVVVDLEEMGEEIEQVEGSGRSVEGLRISDRANVILPYHRILDGAEEKYRGKKGVGTTGRGIGPCYSDKMSRHGIRMCDLRDPQTVREKVGMVLPMKERMVDILGGSDLPGEEELVSALLDHGERYGRFITDTSVLINQAIEEGKKVLFEGAQGTMLDIDHGTFPYVTSSNTVSGAICTGAGVPPSSIGDVIGVVKAYTTRVGSGPFPSELHGEQGDHLLHKGGEFGTTTGRPRRCGWLDLVVVRHAIRLSGVNSLAITKLDVLNDMDTIKVATAYEIDGELIHHFPASNRDLAEARPVYQELEGWKDWEGSAEEVAKKGYDSLPEKMREYIQFISKETGVPPSILSLGKRRDETIDLRSRWGGL
ncbi:MAG: adenylosuccinate synthase [Methanomassiliicoccales archaeon]